MLISNVYNYGHHARAHYLHVHKSRRSNWAYVPKNKPSKRSKRVNPHVHQYELAHGVGMVCASIADFMMRS